MQRIMLGGPEPWCDVFDTHDLYCPCWRFKFGIFAQAGDVIGAITPVAACLSHEATALPLVCVLGS
jgi:hypothetical protein